LNRLDVGVPDHHLARLPVDCCDPAITFYAEDSSRQIDGSLVPRCYLGQLLDEDPAALRTHVFHGASLASLSRVSSRRLIGRSSIWPTSARRVARPDQLTQRVEAGALIAKSGGDPDDPGAGFSDMANVHFEVIESAHPLLAHAGTVNPHQFLENLYAYAATNPACF